MGQLAKWLIRMTHRIVYREVYTEKFANGMRYVPQWWFLWWHYYWRPLLGNWYIPEGFATVPDAEEFFHDKGIHHYKE